MASVFANDISDHCVVATVRNTKIPKSKPCIITKRNMKHFKEPAFLHDLYNFDCGKIYLIPEVESAWNYFYESFTYFINKHAPFRKFRVKGRHNVWFTPELSNLLRERNLAWSKARSTNLKEDWLIFRQLRNMSTAAIRKGKVDHFLLETSNNLNNSKTFWKNIKSLIGSHSNSDFPSYIIKDSCKIVDKAKIIDCLTEHFVAIGTLHDSQNLTHDNSSTVYSSVNHFKLDQLFDFNPVTISEVNKALKSLDGRKQAGPDKLDPHFLKLAADFIAPPLTYLFNLSLSTNEIPSIWKTAYVQPLFKGVIQLY